MPKIYQQFIKQLSLQNEKAEAEAIAKILFQNVFPNLSSTQFKGLKLDDKIVQEKFSLLQNYFFRLACNEPLQYILEEVEFLNCSLLVNKNVLIPRPETEELVSIILKKIKAEGVQNFKLIDFCTGSGCMAIAIAKAFPNATIFALEKSEKAIELAKKNALKNNVKIQFLQTDIFEFETDTQFDFMVSNPPYILEKEMKQMDKNVLAYEPHQALFVADNSPLIFYEKLKEIALKNLVQNGEVFLEINSNFAKETKQLFAEKFSSKIEKDMFGKNRFVIVDFAKQKRATVLS